MEYDEDFIIEIPEDIILDRVPSPPTIGNFHWVFLRICNNTLLGGLCCNEVLEETQALVKKRSLSDMSASSATDIVTRNDEEKQDDEEISSAQQIPRAKRMKLCFGHYYTAFDSERDYYLECGASTDELEDTENQNHTSFDQSRSPIVLSDDDDVPSTQVVNQKKNTQTTITIHQQGTDEIDIHTINLCVSTSGDDTTESQVLKALYDNHGLSFTNCKINIHVK
jgi:hypothetical protein